MGLAQAGMIKRKNSLTMLMQTLTGAAIGSILWLVIGYSLTFSGSIYGIIGNVSNVLLLNVSIHDCEPSLAPHIPEILFASFHMVLCIYINYICVGVCIWFTVALYIYLYNICACCVSPF